MSVVNAVLRPIFDAALAPFQGMHYLVSLTIVSVVFGIVALLVYKVVSNQEGLDAAKQKIYADLFEIRLYNDDLRAIFRAMGGILRHNLTYLRLQLLPILFLLPPFVLVVAQLQFHYGYQGLEPGASTLLKIELTEGWEDEVGTTGGGVKPDLEVELPDGFELESPMVWARPTREAAWRVRAGEPGNREIVFRVGEERVTKSVRVSDRIVRRSPYRVKSQLDQLLFPAEPPLAQASPVAGISLDYPETGMWLEVPVWIWLFIVISVAAGFALKGVFGVTL